MADYALLALLIGMPTVAASLLVKGWYNWLKNPPGSTKAKYPWISVVGLIASSTGLLLSVALMIALATWGARFSQESEGTMFVAFQFVQGLCLLSIVVGFFGDARVRLCIVGSSLATIASWMSGVSF